MSGSRVTQAGETLRRCNSIRGAAPPPLVPDTFPYVDAELFKMLVYLCLCYMADESGVDDGISQEHALLFLGRVTMLLLSCSVRSWFTNITSAETEACVV